MLGYMLTSIADVLGERWSIRSAGTLVVEGSAMSVRTRNALLAIDELGAHRYGAHRSHQIDASDVEWADVILASEAEHVRFVRANFRDASSKAVQVLQFVRRAPLDVAFTDQLAAVSSLDLSSSNDVVDPAGGDQDAYDECAWQLWHLAKAFALLVTPAQP